MQQIFSRAWLTFVELVSISPGLFSRFVVSLIASTVLSFGIGFVYKYTNYGLSYEASFLSTLVALAPIVACVMFFIQGDLVLSLGLVGSLSIIRFRTPIKDTRDMVFLFWSIATGLGAGTYNLGIVIISSIIITLVFVLMYLIRYGVPRNAQYMLVISGPDTYPALEIEQIIASYKMRAYVRSHEVKEGVWERIIELNLHKSDPGIVNELVNEVTEIEEIEKISLLAPQLVLPM